MRISSKQILPSYLRNLELINNRKQTEEVRLSTGKKITTISDEPKDLVDSKLIQNKIETNNTYIRNIENSLNEMRLASEIIDHLSGQFQKIKELSIDATQIGNLGQTESLAVYVKGILEDIVRNSNENMNGSYLFSGTKTILKSLENIEGSKIDGPFELIEGEKTLDNPSGLKVIFKGNNEERTVNKDNYSIEKINVTSEELYGKNLDAINYIIKLYNILRYDEDGNIRKEKRISLEEFDKLNFYQQQIANNVDNLNRTNSVLGSRINRLESYRTLYESTNIRLNDIFSIKSDTDVAKSAMNLKMEETALQYSLSIGSKILPNTLFDFLR
jgi:flagellar hook-associated protein 3 FlgL